MALIKYKCRVCGEVQLVFSGEEKTRLKVENCCVLVHWLHKYHIDMPVQQKFKPLPPKPMIVHATNSFMATEFMLDSTWTIHDLDRQLNFEVSEEKEVQKLNDFRIAF